MKTSIISNISIPPESIKNKIRTLKSVKRHSELYCLSEKISIKWSILLDVPGEFDIQEFTFGTKRTLIASYNEFFIFLETPTGPVKDFITEKIATVWCPNEDYMSDFPYKYALWESDMKTLHTVNMSKEDVGKLREMFDWCINNNN